MVSRKRELTEPLGVLARANCQGATLVFDARLFMHLLLADNLE